jgi:cytochrome c biogenesis protein CcdA
VLRLIGIVISIGLADSVNPSTLAPGLYLASGQHARKRVLEFTLGVFGVSLIGGLAVAVGPGELLLHLVPRPRPIIEYWLEIIAGAVLLVSGALVWRFRKLLSQRDLVPAQKKISERSSLLLGAGIMAVELPTAFPYFAAIAAIVGSGRDIVKQVLLVALYNACFVLPLVGILAVLWLAPERSSDLLGRIRTMIQDNWTLALSLVLLIAGAFCIALGATGVTSLVHNDFGHLARRLHHLIT